MSLTPSRRVRALSKEIVPDADRTPNSSCGTVRSYRVEPDADCLAAAYGADRMSQSVCEMAVSLVADEVTGGEFQQIGMKSQGEQ